MSSTMSGGGGVVNGLILRKFIRKAKG